MSTTNYSIRTYFKCRDLDITCSDIAYTYGIPSCVMHWCEYIDEVAPTLLTSLLNRGSALVGGREVTTIYETYTTLRELRIIADKVEEQYV